MEVAGAPGGKAVSLLVEWVFSLEPKWKPDRMNQLTTLLSWPLPILYILLILSVLDLDGAPSWVLLR